MHTLKNVLLYPWRLAGPVGPAGAVADMVPGAAVAVAAATAPGCHRPPFARAPPHKSPDRLAPSPYLSPNYIAPLT